MEAIYPPIPTGSSFDGEESWTEEEYEIYLCFVELVEDDSFTE